MTTQNIALIIAYDGTEFYGWQKSCSGPSVEEALENRLQQILQEPLTLQAASRTDRGVHAEGQCINFFTNRAPAIQTLMSSLNSLLPPKIRVLKASFMPLHFHPTLHAEKKEYHYQISKGHFQLPQNRHYSWHVPNRLNIKLMRESAAFFLGTHDFSSFCNNRKNLNYTNKIRTIDNLEIFEIDADQLLLKISGRCFLYKMARNIVGTLVDVGRGKIPIERLPELFLRPHRPHSGLTAPAHGLTLKKIYYSKEFQGYL